MTLSIPQTIPPAPSAETHAPAQAATTTDTHLTAATGNTTKLSLDDQVHQLQIQGHTPSEISVELSITPSTVATDLFIGIPKMLATNQTGSISVTA